MSDKAGNKTGKNKTTKELHLEKETMKTITDKIMTNTARNVIRTI